MNTLLSHSLIAITAGLIGGLSSSLFFSETKKSAPIIISQETASNSFDAQAYAPEDIQRQIQYLQQQVNVLDSKLSELAEQKTGNSTHSNPEELTNSSISNRDNIINSGINIDTADEILFRIDQQNDRRAELHTLIQTSDASERRKYSKELLELNKNKITLRSEMGDDAFDQYLFLSDQNNRIKVGSVLSDSPAESAGFLPNDIILYYDNHKVLSPIDIRPTFINGETDSYINVQIIRDGEEILLTVPRGTLGIQLEPLQVDPNSGY